MTRRDLLYALRAKRAGAKHVLKTIQEARRVGVPLSWAFALVEQETAPLGSPDSFRNIFGHDRGSILKGLPVTKARVTELMRWVALGPEHPSNGVGLTQLTSPHLIQAADRLGGAHKPRYQLRVGLTYLKTVTRGHYDTQAWHYNGARSYQALIAARQRKWHRLLTKGKA